MAASTSTPTTRTRVASIRAMSEPELRRRRALGDISCAECRRCRIRCDKKVPCGSCTRRGCVTLCPNGTLIAGKGARFVLSDTQELHEHILTMSQRIRQLEDALATAANQHTASGVHPLLSDDLLAIKFGPESRTNGELSTDSHEDESGADRNLSTPGSLFRFHDGSTKYFGPSGGSETVLLAGDESTADHVGGASHGVGQSFSFISDCHNYQDRMYMLMESLPDSATASALCESYLDGYTWFFRPLSRGELFQELLVSILSQRNTGGHPDAGQRSAQPHRMAVLFFVFAIAASTDQSHTSESGRYYRLGRMALSMGSVFDTTQLDTVRAVSLMAVYISNSGGKHAVEEGWLYLGLAIRLAISIGLHREPTKWDSQWTEEETDRRRRLFWELYALEINHCLVLGRPSCISTCYIDCKLPTPEEINPDGSGKPSPDLWDIKYHLARDVYTLVLEHVSRTKSVKYSEIVKLSQKLRDVTPAVFDSLLASHRPQQSPSFMLSYLCSQYQFHTVLLIHKPALVAALLENPVNPLSTEFAPSLLSANRCASFLTHTLVGQFEKQPEPYHRFWFPWVQGFCAAMILGSIGLHSPGCSLAENAIGDLSSMVELFQQGKARGCRRAAIALPYLVRLRENALRAYAKIEPNSLADSGPHAFSDSDQGRDLMAFAGYPAVVSFDEASHIWRVPQQGTMHQGYERLAIHAPGLTPSPDLNAEFKSMVRIASSSSSPLNSLSTTPDPAASFVPPSDLQGPMLAWMPTEGIAPPFDSYGSVYDDRVFYRDAYIPAERDAENRWDTFLLDAGILPSSPHDNFR